MPAHNYWFAEGSPGVTLDEVSHLMIPGRYRSADGMGLSDLTTQRVDTAADFYRDNNLMGQTGVVVASGYKNPGDHVGEPWRDENGVEYEGVPEAFSMRARFLGHRGLEGADVIVEVRSVDTVTNFTNSQGLFPDERPVGIVAQEAHLERILDIIAPKTMRRPYVGIIVPELEGHYDKDGLSARLVSQWVVRGITPETPNASEIAEARVQKIWQGINTVKSLYTLPQRLAQRKSIRA
jgi:hypothetical protein